MKRALLAAYRVRFPVTYAVVVTLLAIAFAGFLPLGDAARATRSFVWLGAMIVGVVCVIVTLLGSRFLPERRTLMVASPVRGRWLALNSPASRVPSHGVRGYGQAYAIDLVAEPFDRIRPGFGGGPLMRASDEYPAFGEPVFAMIEGTVVRASDWRRDHRARSHWMSLLYLMFEGVVREIGGPGFILGNHVIIRGDDETGRTFAAVAHLQSGSALVRVGDQVRAGQQIGRCGNSGNSTEPHVHAQLMDRASAWTAQGTPLAFVGITLDDDTERVTGVPKNEQHLTADASPTARE